MYATATLKMTGKQLVSFGIGDGNARFDSGSNVGNRISAYFPHEANTFFADRQNTRDIQPLLSPTNRLFIIVVILTLAVLLIVVPTRRKPVSPQLRLLFWASATTIVLNSADCAAFTEVVGRYGCKLIWLIPFCGLAWLLQPKQAD
jgi:hypothetical protein